MTPEQIAELKLPWRHSERFDVFENSHGEVIEIHAECGGRPDIICSAVNSLPAYQAMREALELLCRLYLDHPALYESTYMSGAAKPVYDKARAALALAKEAQP